MMVASDALSTYLNTQHHGAVGFIDEMTICQDRPQPPAFFAPSRKREPGAPPGASPKKGPRKLLLADGDCNRLINVRNGRRKYAVRIGESPQQGAAWALTSSLSDPKAIWGAHANPLASPRQDIGSTGRKMTTIPSTVLYYRHYKVRYPFGGLNALALNSLSLPKHCTAAMSLPRPPTAHKHAQHPP